MSYPATGPIAMGIDGKASVARRRPGHICVPAAAEEALR